MTWDGLNGCWWLLTPDGVCAISSDLAGLWHDDGASAIFFGTYKEAAALIPAAKAKAPAEPQMLFEQREVA